MIEKGVWKARACGSQLGHTNGGKPQLGIDLLILEGPSAGAHITWYGYFTEATFERTIETCRVLGWGGSDLSDLSGIDANEVNVVIDHEQNPETGEVHARAQWINALGGVVMKNRMDAGAAAAFAAEMKGRIIALGAQDKRPTRAPTSPGAGRAPADDDNIPF